MRGIMLVLCCLLQPLSAAAKMDIDVVDAPLVEVLAQIQEAGRFNLAYSRASLVDENGDELRVTATFDDMPPLTALKLVCQACGVVAAGQVDEGLIIVNPRQHLRRPPPHHQRSQHPHPGADDASGGRQLPHRPLPPTGQAQTKPAPVSPAP